MGTGWRRAFCTSIRREPDTAAAGVERQPCSSPRNCTRLGFFGNSSSSNPSTPRLLQKKQRSSLPSTSTLRCRTKSPAACPGAASGVVVSDSPILQCKTTVAAAAGEVAAPGSRGQSPRLPFLSSNPNQASPRSPSRFALLRSSLHLTRSSCRICLQSVKARQGTAIFTAECSHVFHYHCIAASVRKQGSLVCPVCGAPWRQVSLLSDVSAQHHPTQLNVEKGSQKNHSGLKQEKFSTAGDNGLSNKKSSRGVSDVGSRVYNDDEPLLSPTACAARRFNPIPEADDEQQEEAREGDDDEEFRGFFSVNPFPLSSPRSTTCRRHQFDTRLAASSSVQVTVLPDSSLLSASRSHENYVITLKVKAPSPSASLLVPSRRAPIDLVTVLDVGGGMTGSKLHMLKRSVRLVIASLGPSDRLSIVAFSTSSKRLLALRRMSPDGQRAAQRIVDRLVCGDGSYAGEALKKAVKVLKDRRERNPVASIMLLSDGQQQQAGERHDGAGGHRPAPPSDVSFSPNTLFAHLEIPVHASGVASCHRREDAEDVFARCVGGLLSVVLQDVRLEFAFPSGDVCSVYSCSGGRPAAIGGCADPLRLGDMYADEERELLVELKVPSVLRGRAERGHLSVRCTYRDPSTQELVHCREQQPLVFLTGNNHPAPAKGVRLRNLFVATRSIAEARRLADHGDFATGLHLLSSAQRLLLRHSSSASHNENIRAVEAELEELQRRRQQMRRSEHPEASTAPAWKDGGGAEALTPTSAWRAAERLAKVAIMRKSLNRVSDLHGLENARF